MFSKSTFVFAFLAVAKLAVATPPACLLAALDTQQTLNDYDAICGDSAKDVQTTIQSACTGNSVKLALSAFADACKAKGHTVPTASIVSSSASATGTKSANASQTTNASLAPTVVVYTSAVFDSSCSCTKTEVFSSTALAGASGIVTATATGAGSHATGGASGTGAGSHASGTATGTGAAAQSTGAAGRIEGSMIGGLLAVGAGILAVL